MPISRRVRFLNVFRNIFKISFLEKSLAALTRGKSTDYFFSKLVPNAYQYPPYSFRMVHQNGLNLRVDIGDYIGHYLYFGFEDKGIENLFSLCRPDSYVVDVGTNIGWTFLNLAKRCPNGKIAGFEPDPDNFKVGLQNIQMNQFSNAVLLPKGLGAQAVQVMMEVRTPANRGGNRIAPSSGKGSVLVDIERLDQVKEIKSWKRVDLIKIDVEGYELHVLKGANSILSNFKPILFIEVDDNNLRDQGHSAMALIQFLEEIGYQNIRHAESKEPISSRSNFTQCHFDVIASHDNG